MTRLLKITALSFVAVLLWAVLFQYKTCACGDKVSLADRAINLLLGK